MGAISRFKARLDAAKKKRLQESENRKSIAEQEKRRAEAVYAEEKAKINRENLIAKQAEIEERARIRAREGGFLKRAARSGAKYGLAYGSAYLAAKKEARPRKRRKSRKTAKRSNHGHSRSRAIHITVRQ